MPRNTPFALISRRRKKRMFVSDLKIPYGRDLVVFFPKAEILLAHAVWMCPVSGEEVDEVEVNLVLRRVR